ncbi:hypothetical protein LCGC14_1717920 [marine sediment metagenome]|uniref:Uncharacterized protein n=1 Tax=marine sediment metagenome TaxID=412755 RepID=A0A0F9KD71_9ZZZZ
MDKRDKMMIAMLSEQINYYSDALSRAESLHKFAIHSRQLSLASTTKRASMGLSELIDHFSFQQDAIMKRNGAINIPIKLKKDIYDFHFKEFHTKGDSSG